MQKLFSIASGRGSDAFALQDALLRAYRNLKRFQGNSRFYTWLVRILSHVPIPIIQGADQDFNRAGFFDLR